MDVTTYIANLPEKLFENIFLGFLSMLLLTLIGVIARWIMVSLKVTASTTIGLFDSLKAAINLPAYRGNIILKLPETLFAIIFTVLIYLLPFVVSICLSIVSYIMMFSDAFIYNDSFNVTLLAIIFGAALIRYLPYIKNMLTYIGLMVTYTIAVFVAVVSFIFAWHLVWSPMLFVQYIYADGQVAQGQALASAGIAGIIAAVFFIKPINNTVRRSIGRAKMATGITR